MCQACCGIKAKNDKKASEAPRRSEKENEPGKVSLQLQKPGNRLLTSTILERLFEFCKGGDSASGSAPLPRAGTGPRTPSAVAREFATDYLIKEVGEVDAASVASRAYAWVEQNRSATEELSETQWEGYYLLPPEAQVIAFAVINALGVGLQKSVQEELRALDPS